jgi:hypothetical protein
VGGEKQNLVPINSNLQVLSMKNVTKIHKNVFKSGSDAENPPKWHCLSPAGLFADC